MAQRRQLSLINLACQCSRFNMRAGQFGRKSPTGELYNGMAIDNSFRKQWRPTGRITCQEYHKQATQIWDSLPHPEGELQITN